MLEIMWPRRRCQPAFRDEQNAGLERIVALLNRKLARGPVTDIGSLSVWATPYSHIASYWVGIRSQRLPSFADAEFRFAGPGGIDYSANNIAYIVRGLVAAIRRFEAAREEVIVLTRAARDAALTTIDRYSALAPPARLLSIGVIPSWNPEYMPPFSVVVEVEMLGDDNSLVIDRVTAATDEELETAFDDLLAAHVCRAAVLTQLKATNTKYLVEVSALRVMSAFAKTFDEVLEDLASNCWLALYSRDDRSWGAIFWRDGILGRLRKPRRRYPLQCWRVEIQIRSPGHNFVRVGQQADRGSRDPSLLARRHQDRGRQS